MVTGQETPHHMYSVGEHTLHAMKNIRADKALRLTMLLHDMGKPARKTVDEQGVAHFKKHAAESQIGWSVTMTTGCLRRRRMCAVQ